MPGAAPKTIQAILQSNARQAAPDGRVDLTNDNHWLSLDGDILLCKGVV